MQKLTNAKAARYKYKKCNAKKCKAEKSKLAETVVAHPKMTTSVRTGRYVDATAC